ncbi:hypothetical protein [Sphaerochaeta globosa]|uniref:ParB/Sulfiredoxin domain-containing protein n=1 Tax=Sphaerochaeta globosa (strain ATCC BAA-1886 / DSM 22777 / Buddy) TaxID=158189 RepID=F0RTE4_SPHGB|nr:hypothetical protein [Sphaerochaeta globosa]ADY14426.1 hypothetical protein SpiBuddy_2615 [Sphaerochaeta globosa str. Buddy]
MDKSARERKIQEVLKTTPIKTGIHLTLRNKSRDFNVYQIPLDCLIYNSYNGRFKSKFKTYEAIHGRKLNSEISSDMQIINDFLWKSNEPKNKQTMDDIREKGQQQSGIVTRDGQIIDGNRRFMVLSKLHEIYPTQFEYFEAVILTEDIDERELVRLETEVQLGTDEKEGYNAIEKYLRVDELLNEYTYTPEAIAKMMNLTIKDIEKYQQIYQLFKEYLEFIGYPEYYDLLEGVEDPILQLHSAVSRLEKGSHSANLSRTINPEEIEQLKLIVFDTIRIKPTNDHKIVREIIGKPNAKTADGIFGRKAIWEDFFEKHMEKVHKRIAPTVQALKTELATDDFESSTNDIEKTLQNTYSKEMRTNLDKAIREVKIDNEDDKVLVIVETIRDSTKNLFDTYHDLLIAQYSKNKEVKKAIAETIENLTMIQKEMAGS